jgi:hypothetical protein
MKGPSFLFLIFLFANASACGFVESNKDSKKKKSSKSCEESKDEGGFFLSDKGKYCVKITWLEGPKVEDFSSAELEIRNPDLSVPGKIKKISVEPWMKIHGHGTGDVQPELALKGNHKNIFILSNVYFIMSGPWELNIKATIDEITDTLEYNVKVD